MHEDPDFETDRIARDEPRPAPPGRGHAAELEPAPFPDASGSVARNVAAWTRHNREYTDGAAARAWAAERITWGVFGVPDEALGSPLGDVAGLDIVELGCGTAYLSAWLAGRGARPVGVDPTPAQLDTARRMQELTGVRFPIIQAPGEDVPLPDRSFDLAISEYGASLWAEPERWVAEAARLLRPGGRLVFLTASMLAQLCAAERGPMGERLLRPLAGLHHIDWPDDEGTEYALSHGDWIRLLRRHGFDVLDLVEVYASPEATLHARYDEISPAWASRWPAEELWVARLRI